MKVKAFPDDLGNITILKHSCTNVAKYSTFKLVKH